MSRHAPTANGVLCVSCSEPREVTLDFAVEQISRSSEVALGVERMPRPREVALD